MASGGGDLPAPRAVEADCPFCETFGEWVLYWERRKPAGTVAYVRCENCGAVMEAKDPKTGATPIY